MLINTDPSLGTKIGPKKLSGNLGSSFLGAVLLDRARVNTGPSLGTKIGQQSCSWARCTNTSLIWAAVGVTPACLSTEVGFGGGVPYIYI